MITVNVFGEQVPYNSKINYATIKGVKKLTEGSAAVLLNNKYGLTEDHYLIIFNDAATPLGDCMEAGPEPAAPEYGWRHLGNGEFAFYGSQSIWMPKYADLPKGVLLGQDVVIPDELYTGVEKSTTDMDGGYWASLGNNLYRSEKNPHIFCISRLYPKERQGKGYYFKQHCRYIKAGNGYVVARAGVSPSTTVAPIKFNKYAAKPLHEVVWIDEVYLYNTEADQLIYHGGRVQPDREFKVLHSDGKGFKFMEASSNLTVVDCGSGVIECDGKYFRRTPKYVKVGVNLMATHQPIPYRKGHAIHYGDKFKQLTTIYPRVEQGIPLVSIDGMLYEIDYPLTAQSTMGVIIDDQVFTAPKHTASHTCAERKIIRRLS